MLSLVGMGLEKGDLTEKALKAIKGADKVFVENYTSIPYEFDAEEMGRDRVESDFLLNLSKTKDIVLLVPGDPLFATTHTSLFFESKKLGIPCQIIHAPSVLNALARTGLSTYRFGRIVTLSKPFESDRQRILNNLKSGLHTLCLLDPSLKIKDGISVLSEFGLDLKLVACARLGTSTEIIRYGPQSDLAAMEFGPRPHCLIVPAELQFYEKEFVSMFSIQG